MSAPSSPAPQAMTPRYAGACDLDEQVEIRPESVGIEGSTVYLEAGRPIRSRELLQALIQASATTRPTPWPPCGGQRGALCGAHERKGRSLGLKTRSSKIPRPEAEGITARPGTWRRSCRGMENADFAASPPKIVEIGPSLRQPHKCSGYTPMSAGKTGYTQAAGRSLVTARSGTDCGSSASR
jgi:hypothetical protein